MSARRGLNDLLWLLCVTTMVGIAGITRFDSLQTVSMRSKIEKALCSDGEAAEGAASDLIKSLPGRVQTLILAIRELERITPSNGCFQGIKEMYLAPPVFSAVQTLLMSEYGPDYLPNSLAEEFRMAKRLNRGDRHVEKFVDNVLLTESK